MTTPRPTAVIPRWGWLALVAISCGTPDDNVADQGGQTGSASCGTSPRCVCDSLVDSDIVRGVVMFRSDSEASVEVLEVFGTTDVSVGDTLVGSYQPGLPCGLGSVPPLDEGSEVLVGYQAATGSGLMPSMYVVTWSATLRLTAEFTLAASDVAILATPAACGERFPDEEVMCKDNF